MKIFYSIILSIILFFPKVNIINLPGTYIGIRIEDVLALAFVIIYVIKENKKLKGLFTDNNMKKTLMFFGIYIFVCFVSTINGIINEIIDIKMSLLYLLRKIEYFIFIFIGYDMVKKEKDLKFIFNILNISIIIHFIIAVLQRLNIVGGFINGGYLIHTGRVFSTFNGPYEFATYFTLILPLYIMRLLKSKKHIEKILYLIFTGMILIGIFLSQSRTSLILAIFEIISIPLIKNKSILLQFIKKKKLISSTVIIISITVLIVAGSLILKTGRFKTLNLSSIMDTIKISWENKNFERYKKEGFYLLGEENTDLSFKIRINKWMALIDGTMNHPIFGLGLSVTKEACDGNYIRILAESGILGFLAWLCLIISILKNTYKCEDDINFIANYDMIILLLTAIFIDVFEASKIMMFYWLILGAAYAHNNIINKEREKGEE